jgi:hypothetical protein
MSGPRTKYLTTTRDTLARVADEAQAQALAAEDALGALEDREARRATRSGGRN